MSKVTDIAKQFTGLTQEELRELNHILVSRIRATQNISSQIAKAKFYTGQEVKFRTKEGKIITAKIIKINSKNIKCQEISTPNNLYWNVSPNFLSPAQ